MEVLKHNNETEPLKSTRKGTVVTVQAVSVLAVLEAINAALSLEIPQEWIAIAATLLTGVAHGAIKALLHRLGIEIRFKPSSTSVLLFLLLPTLLLSGCAMVRQAQQDDAGSYKSLGVAFGKGNIADLQTHFQQEVTEANGGGSTTLIGQTTDSIVAEGERIIADTIGAAVRGAVQVAIEEIRKQEPAEEKPEIQLPDMTLEDR